MTNEEKIKEGELKWIGIDFDKTLAKTSGYPKYKLLRPIEDSQWAMSTLTKWGYKIVVFTSRPWNDYEKVENWMNENNIPFSRIVCGKLFVKVLIDDRAIGFRGNWAETLDELKTYLNE